MRIPTIQGVIDRRILASYRVDPDIMARMLPDPFRPLIVNGHAIAGICLIRLKRVRPRFLPIPYGIRSENAAHRIAVEWDVDGQIHQGVYIPRRDTDSRLNTWAGGALFPGIYHHARFTLQETNDQVSVTMQSTDGETRVHVSRAVADTLPDSSVFPNLSVASQFFALGSLGYSATRTRGRFDGLELRCETWDIEPLDVDKIESSYFDDRSQFPTGSIGFDCALLMRGIRHQWHGREDLCCTTTVGA